MKRKLVIIFAAVCLVAIAVFAANPSFQSFLASQFASNNSQIGIKSGATVTNLNIYSSLQFPSNGSSIISWTNVLGFVDDANNIRVTLAPDLTGLQYPGTGNTGLQMTHSTFQLFNPSGLNSAINIATGTYFLNDVGNTDALDWSSANNVLLPGQSSNTASLTVNSAATVGYVLSHASSFSGNANQFGTDLSGNTVIKPNAPLTNTTLWSPLVSPTANNTVGMVIAVGGGQTAFAFSESGLSNNTNFGIAASGGVGVFINGAALSDPGNGQLLVQSNLTVGGNLTVSNSITSPTGNFTTLNGGTITGTNASAIKQITLTDGSLTLSSTSVTIDWSAGGVQHGTLATNVTFSFSNVTNGMSLTVLLYNTASNYTVTWPTKSSSPPLLWQNAVAPTMTTGTNADVYTFVAINGTNYGTALQGFHP